MPSTPPATGSPSASHSRIDSASTGVAGASARATSTSIRNMVGAVVGVQPFGGEGLSGHRAEGRRAAVSGAPAGPDQPAGKPGPRARRPGADAAAGGLRGAKAWAATPGGGRSPRPAVITGRRACSPGKPGSRAHRRDNRLFCARGAVLCRAGDEAAPAGTTGRGARLRQHAGARCRRPAAAGCRRSGGGACVAWQPANPRRGGGAGRRRRRRSHAIRREAAARAGPGAGDRRRSAH